MITIDQYMHLTSPISPGLICVRRVFWLAYLRGTYLRGGGAYTRCKKMFSLKMIQNSKFASLKRVILSMTIL